MQLVQRNGAAIFALAPPRRTRHDKHRPCQTAVGSSRPSTSFSEWMKTWMPGIADKFTQSAKSRLLWPGMTNFIVAFSLSTTDERNHGPHALRHVTEGLTAQSSDLLVGRLVDRGVQPSLQKYFGFHTPQITSRTLRIPSHTEGRFAIVTDVGHGMWWTRQRLARNGIAGRMMNL
jgi:hypothetical protein